MLSARFNRCFLFAAIPLSILWAYAAFPAPDLSEWSDVELFLNADRETAHEILDPRIRDYSPKEMQGFKDALAAEIKFRSENKSQASADALLQQLKNPLEDSKKVDPAEAFYEAFEKATAPEKISLRTQLISDWETIGYPGPTEDHADAEKKRTLFQRYLQLAPRLYDDEIEVLKMLESRCLDRGIEGAQLLFIQGLQAQGETAGPATAGRVEKMFHDLSTWGVAEIGYSERGDILPYLYTILSNCDQEGINVLIRLDLASTDNGIQSLAAIDLPKAETLLWDIYQNTDDKLGAHKIKALSAIQVKQARDPSTERRDKIRQELIRFLRIPEGEISLAVMDAAIQLAGRTGDQGFLPHIDALETRLKILSIKESFEYANNPENAKRWQANCLEHVQSTREMLSENVQLVN